jgi:hypothetical protein
VRGRWKKSGRRRTRKNKVIDKLRREIRSPELYQQQRLFQPEFLLQQKKTRQFRKKSGEGGDKERVRGCDWRGVRLHEWIRFV